MQDKYQSSEIPLLVDGDCLGVFYNPNADEDVKTLCELITEGYDRGEQVYATASYLGSCSKLLGVRQDFQYPKAFIFQSMAGLLDDLTRLRLESINNDLSGVRVLLHTEDFQDAPILQVAYHEVMLLLMQGAVSIAIAVPHEAGVSLAFLSSFPRLLIGKKVCRNHFFFSQVNIEKSIPVAEQLLRNLFRDELAEKNDDKPFPMGVPDMLGHIIESMGAGVVVGDIYGNMVLLNAAAQKIMGLPPSPLPYAERVRRFGNFLPDKATPYPLENLPLSRAIRGEHFDQELLYVKNKARPEGAWMHSYGRGIRTEDGELVGGVCIFMDVSQQIEMQKENEELERALGQTQKFESLGLLAGGVAHDFNNLLVGVLGNVSFLLEDPAFGVKQRVRLQQIDEASSQLADLTRQLLTYAGMSSEKAFEFCDLSNICSDMSSLLSSGVDKAVKVSFELSSDGLMIEADQTQVKQVLLNLTMNASDAMRASAGHINVRTAKVFLNKEDLRRMFFSEGKESGRYALLEVSDSGCGMSVEVMDRIFDPFFSSKGVGRGLGLSSVLGIVKGHDACLKVDSEERVGTTFSLYFEIRDDKGVKESVPKVRVSRSYLGLNALVIDDEKIVLDVARGILEHQEFEVETIDTGRKAIEYLNNSLNSLSLIVVDMTLPDLSGLDIYQHIRSLNSEIPIIISSGFSKEACGGDFDQDNYCTYLAKPYRASELIAVVNSLFNVANKDFVRSV